MTKIDKNEKLEGLIKKGESDNVEFKPSLSQINEIIQTVSGFSNFKGGIILIGISDSGKILGCEIGKNTIENLTNIIKQNIEPIIHPEISIGEIDCKKIIVIEVFEAIDKPVLAYGKLYKRVGKSTLLASRHEFEKLVLEKHKEKIQFDSQICTDANFDDIDKNKVRKYIELYEEINKTSFKGSDKELLKSLNCIKEINGKIKVTNAGILLFGKKPEKFYSMNYITIARYPGIELGSKYLDIKDFYGTLFDIIDNVSNYIKEHIEERSEVIEGEIARRVMPQYPYYAIRELITNAIVHRNYNIRGSRIIIRIFKDRIEFNSPGSLPADITPKNIISSQYSRNPVIADVLHRARYIEKMGEGWDKIIDSIKKHPLKPKLPKIIDSGGNTIITLFSPNEMIKEEKVTKKVTEKIENRELVEGLVEGLVESQKKILEFIKNNPYISKRELAEKIGISETAIDKNIEKLKQKVLLKRIGPDKGGYWEVLNK